MTPSHSHPILVTGLPRSGTSWVGTMLGGVYLNEPLNPRHPPGRLLPRSVPHRFLYICGDNEDAWLPAFRDLVALRRPAPWPGRDLARRVKYGCACAYGRLRGQPAIFDDPFALLSAAWFADRLGCRVLVLIRDPVALAGSWLRLGWDVDPACLLEQPLLVRDHLGPWIREIRSCPPDPLHRCALLWRLTYRVVAEMDRVRLARYEDLVRDPLEGFRSLYDWAGLTWGRPAARRVTAGQVATGQVAASASSSSRDGGGGFSWRGLSRTAYRPMSATAALGSYRSRLTPAQIDLVRELTADPGWSP